ncbi:e14 prophage; site-specific DNA recombinase (fragment) [Burkholderia multivorans]
MIGDARVSTDGQHPDLQRDALAKAGCERVFKDPESGAKTERAGLTTLLATLCCSDTVPIWQLGRFGRSLKDLIHLVERLDAAGIGLQRFQESIGTVSMRASR